MWEWLKALILGIVEGITEWLPISSTGHLILMEKWLAFFAHDAAFREMFEVVIQLGAILAVVILYWNRLWPFCADRRLYFVKKDSFLLWLKVAVGVLPTAVAGFFLDDRISSLFYNERVNAMVVAIALIVYGILFIVLEYFNRGREFRYQSVSEIPYSVAFGIGCFQILAMIPGTSRSGVTILGAMLLSASRTASAEFSFFMSIPVMFGASLLKVVKYVMAFRGGEAAAPGSSQWVCLGIGMVVAFLVSVAAIRFLMNFIRKRDFAPFGWYRIGLGVLVLLSMVIF